MKQLKHWIPVAIFFVTSLVAQTAWAATYYVDRNLPGRDTNAGTTEATAFLTIAKCVQTATRAGDSCLVKNGTYPEGVMLRYSGTAGNPIRLANYPGHSPVIRFNDPNVATNRVEILSLSGYNSPVGWITIEGFEITNGWDGIKINSAHNIVIRRNNIHTNRNQGIAGTGYRVSIDRNIIRRSGRFAECASYPPPSIGPSGYNVCNKDHGIYIAGTYHSITNNLIYDNLAYGIVVAGYAHNASAVPGPEYSGASNWLIAHNTMAYQNWRGAITVWNAGGGAASLQGTRIENNIMHENCNVSACGGGGSGIDFVDAGSAGVQVRNNVFFASGTGGTLFVAGGTAGSTYSLSGNSTTANPDMVNAPATLPASPDFRLQSKSLARDKGLLLSDIDVDFEGFLRPQGSGPDIGAYEANTGSSDSTPPAPPAGLRLS